MNLIGVTSFFKALFLKPQLLIPHLEVQDVSKIPFRQLRELGFKGLILDKDNTLTSPYEDYLEPSIQEAVNECLNVFGDQVVIFSNSSGSISDLNGSNAKVIEKNLKIPVLRHNTKKPNGIEAINNYFKCELHELVVIGDRFSTDVLFGNLNGMMTIRTNPLFQDKEFYLIQKIQKIENCLIQLVKNNRKEIIKEHPLLIGKNIQKLENK